MKKSITIIILLSSVFSFGQQYTSPSGYEIIAEEIGDLDKDGITEQAIVFNTAYTTADGIIREIQILKQSQNKWVVWKKSRNAVLKSEEGGMMGDPFENMEIENGILSISFSGGSSWKWAHKDKYRYQNGEFELIGYSSPYGKPCEYWEDFDFNLSTGKIIYKKEFEDCEKDQAISKTETEMFKKGISINLNNRHNGKIKIISPENRYEIFL